MHPIVNCLWFDRQAEEAAQFYLSIFKNARLGKILYFTEAGHEFHRQPAGLAMTVEFELNGQPFMAMNGGPDFKFNAAVSFVVPCDTQAEIDHYWDMLSEGGDPAAQQCGWLKDKYGVSWQIMPADLKSWMQDPRRASKIMDALHDMKKLDIATLQSV